MDEVCVMELKQSVLADNDRDAEALREELRRKGTYYINLMSAPGSGKTSLLRKLIPALGGDCRAGVMEADIDSDVDAKTLCAEGIPTIQLHTGGMCHLDADMSRQGLRAMRAADLVFLENIGNLVCPAEYDTGAFLKLMILALPEGDDKPLKYPLMFHVVDAVIVNKTDAAAYFDFDFARCEAAIRKVNPHAPIFPVSAKTGEGIPELAAWLLQQYAAWRQNLAPAVPKEVPAPQ